MNTRHTPLRTTLLASLFMATATSQADTITLAFETYLPALTDSVATTAALFGDTAIETSTGTYRLPAGSTLSGTIQINLDGAPNDSAASPAFGIYESATDFITIRYDTLSLPNPVPVDAQLHNDVARFETERGGSSSRDLFFYYDGVSSNWTDTTSGLRYALTINSKIWVNANVDGILKSDLLDQPVNWMSSDTVAGEQTDFSLFYRLDTYNGADLVNRDEARITTADVTRVSTVPIPSAIGLFGAGLVGMAGVARRRRFAPKTELIVESGQDLARFP